MPVNHMAVVAYEDYCSRNVPAGYRGIYSGVNRGKVVGFFSIGEAGGRHQRQKDKK